MSWDDDYITTLGNRPGAQVPAGKPVKPRLFSVTQEAVVVADPKAFLHQPLEFNKTVDDGIRLMGMGLCARKYLVDPFVLPASAIEKYGCYPRSLGCRDICGAIADVPAIKSRFFIQVFQRLE